MKINLSRMCVWLMLMTILAAGSCMECVKVDVIEGENATLSFPTPGVTNFYEINCDTAVKITFIGQYCGSNDNCTTSSTEDNVSIEPGRLTLINVTSNKCYRAEPISGKKKCYNVTTTKPVLPSISTEKSSLNVSTATPYNASTPDSSGASNDNAGVVIAIGAVAGVAAILRLIYRYICNVNCNSNTLDSVCVAEKKKERDSNTEFK